MKDETELQKHLTNYTCPECGGMHLVTKPYPKKNPFGGVPYIQSVIKCENKKCNTSRKVRRYPNGTYRSFKIE